MIGYNEKKAVQTEEPDIKLHKLFRIYRPKYEKSPKKSKKRKSLRALSCFALVFAALMASAVGTYAKYISPTVTVEPFSVNAAQFACEVKEFDFSKIDKSQYNLKDTDVIVAAFTVSNEKNGKHSEVDLSVDVALTLQGTYNAPGTWDEDNYSWTCDPKVSENIDFCKALKSELIIGYSDNGNFVKLPQKASQAQSVSSNDIANSTHDPMPMSTIPREMEQKIEASNYWTNVFDISANDHKEYICFIIINTDVEKNGKKLKFTGNDITLQSPGNIPNNLIVTVNQAKASAQGG